MRMADWIESFRFSPAWNLARFASKPADSECTGFLQQRRFAAPLLDLCYWDVKAQSKLSVQAGIDHGARMPIFCLPLRLAAM